MNIDCIAMTFLLHLLFILSVSYFVCIHSSCLRLCVVACSNLSPKLSIGVDVSSHGIVHTVLTSCATFAKIQTSRLWEQWRRHPTLANESVSRRTGRSNSIKAKDIFYMFKAQMRCQSMIFAWAQKNVQVGI